MQALFEFRAVIPLLLVLPLALGVGGCNTMSGVGQDLEAAGSAIDAAAEEEQGY